jgi:hypothetical protein
VQGQKGFFNALKPQSDQFAQTSRVNVARPAAQKKQQAKVVPAPQDHHTLLGTNENTTATPDEQAFLARQNYKDKSATAPVRQQAKTIEQAYVRGDDLKGTKKPIHAESNGTGLQGAASVAAPINAVGQRALGSIAAGIPFGSVSPLALKGIQSLGLPDVERQQVIGGFSHDPSMDNPQVRAAEVALAQSKGHSVPANATTRQLLTAALAPTEHHGSYWDVLKNLPKDALYTPVYAAEGGFALGHATGEALQGHTDELKAIGKSQLQQIEHPGATLQAHPFQTGLAIAAPLKGLGKIGGLATGAEVAPRLVTTADSLGGNVLDRGDLSTNLVDRAAQKASDAVLARSPYLQSRAIAAGTRHEGNLAKLESAHSMRPTARALGAATKGISKARANSLLANEATGATAREWAEHYNNLADHNETIGANDALEPKVRARAQKLAKTQRAQAKVREAQAKRWPDAPNEHEQAYLDAAREGADTRTNMLTGTKTPKGNAALDATSAKWRDYQHNVELRAGQGDELAKKVVGARNALNTTEPGTPEYETGLRNLNRELDTYAASRPAEQPFRVGTIKPKIVSEFSSPGNPVRANTNPGALVSGLGHSSGGALESGNYTVNAGRFAKELVQPHTLQATINYVNRVTDKFGRPAVPGEEIPEGMILRRTDNLRATPNVNVTADAELGAQAEDLKNIRDEFKIDDRGRSTLSHVPNDGKWILLPKAAYKEIAGTVARAPRTGASAGFAKATRAYKNSVLFTRPAYPAGNFVNSAAQAALGGAGPLSFLRRNAFPLPQGVEDAGFVASDLTPSTRSGFRSAIDEAKVVPGAHKVGAIGKGIGRVVDEQYLNRIKTASIKADNVWRKALYAKKALPEARKLAYPDEGLARRLLTRKSASDSAIQDAARAMAEGLTPEAKRAADRAIKATNDFLGDFGAMKHNGAVDLAVPFNSWMRFSGKLLLQTLPLKYPGRTALLYKIGQLGQQATGQQGVLPQYLQESIPFGPSNPQNQGEINTQRANPFATLGNIAPKDDLGVPGTEQALGNASPFLAPLISAFTGNDLETGRALTDAEGNPIKGNPTDIARFLGAQAAGFVPPVGLASSLFEHGKKPAATSLPFVGFQGKKQNAAGPLLQQPGMPAWESIANLVGPVRFSQRNQHADQYYGNKDLRTALAKAQEAENKAALGKPGGVAAVTAKWTKIGNEVNKRYAYYEAHPDALKALIANGVPARGQSGTRTSP